MSFALSLNLKLVSITLSVEIFNEFSNCSPKACFVHNSPPMCNVSELILFELIEIYFIS